MTAILIIGAGRSTTSLIHYLLQQASVLQLRITVADMNLALAQEKINGFENATAIAFDITNDTQRQTLIQSHDLIVSMLPAHMHTQVAVDCVHYGKHLATASYVSKEMNALHEEATKKGVLLLNECGLDPGIDHASAMKIIDEIKGKGGHITSFKSYCGGLVAPESNDNPWGYKFSWNPRNVILAGQSTAQYLQNGELTFIPYNRLFLQTDTVYTDTHGAFDAYANRDSISYKDIYGLANIETLLRGTLRQQGYCKAWHVLVALGLTDDSFVIKNASQLTYKQLIQSFLPIKTGDVKTNLKNWIGAIFDAEVEAKFDFLELLTDKKITKTEGTPAQLLQALLEEKWLLKDGDKDMIVMQHLFEYTLNQTQHKLTSSLIVIGDDENHTAMAKTVGLPLAITIKLFLQGKFKLSGVQIPVKPEIYTPLLAELETLGIVFAEKTH
jgi:saccharopine dehydrogenase-like NADP-dependent oxidoreductase